MVGWVDDATGEAVLFDTWSDAKLIPDPDTGTHLLQTRSQAYLS